MSEPEYTSGCTEPEFPAWWDRFGHAAAQRVNDEMLALAAFAAGTAVGKTAVDLRLATAIRTHRDARGDDRCWMDDETLYAVLPEGYTPPPRDTLVELARCQQFLASRQHPATIYVSPQRRIEELEAQVTELLSVVRQALTILEGPTIG